MENLNKYMEIVGRSKADRDNRRNLFKDALIEAAGDAFNKCPKMYQFAIKFWTPAFNDGSPCKFTSGIDYPVINYYDTDYGEVRDEDENYKEGVVLSDREVDEYAELVSESISAFSISDFKWLYNDYGFRLVFLKNADGSVSVTEEDYDCGY